MKLSCIASPILAGLVLGVAAPCALAGALPAAPSRAAPVVSAGRTESQDVASSQGGADRAGQESVAGILSCVRAALGCDRAARHPGGIHATGSARIAGLDAEYSLLFGGDRAVLQRIAGPFTLESAIDGDVVWIKDIGGEVRRLHHGERAETELGLLLLTHAWLSEGSPLRFELDQAGSTAETISLSFRQGELEGTVAIDRATCLPRGWSYQVGPRRSTVAVNDYLDFDGLKVPSHVELAATSGNAATFRIERVAEAPAFVRSPYAMTDPRPHDARFDAGAAPELEVVKAPTGHLLVHPLVDGRDVGWFIFDTGAGASVLSAPVLKELGIEGFGDVPAQGIGGPTMASFCRPATLSVGPMTIEQPLMVVLDLSFLKQHMGRPIAGLIGYNLLARAVARIDMEAPAISLHDPASFADGSLPWQRLYIEQRLPHVEASFEGHTGRFRLDTGVAQTTVSMHEPAVKRLKLLEGRETTPSGAAGVGGQVPMRSGTLAWFELGGVRTQNVPADFAIEAKGAFADPFALGNIGAKLLKPFVLVMDYGGERIAFVPRDGGA